MAEKYTVADLVAEFLPQVGVSTVFGIVSVHNIPMLDAIGQRNRLRYVKARGEMGGAHMADAYARVTGHLGVIFTSTGPGMANAIPGLVEARFAGSPVLHITGQTATRFIDRDVGTVHDVPGKRKHSPLFAKQPIVCAARGKPLVFWCARQPMRCLRRVARFRSKSRLICNARPYRGRPGWMRWCCPSPRPCRLIRLSWMRRLPFCPKPNAP